MGETGVGLCLECFACCYRVSHVMRSQLGGDSTTSKTQDPPGSFDILGPLPISIHCSTYIMPHLLVSCVTMLRWVQNESIRLNISIDFCDCNCATSSRSLQHPGQATMMIILLSQFPQSVIGPFLFKFSPFDVKPAHGDLH